MTVRTPQARTETCAVAIVEYLRSITRLLPCPTPYGLVENTRSAGHVGDRSAQAAPLVLLIEEPIPDGYVRQRRIAA
jgi:hypothetical protein